MTLGDYNSSWNFVKFWELSATDLSQSLTTLFRKSVQSAENNLVSWFNNRLTNFQNIFKSWKVSSPTNLIILGNLITSFECSETTEASAMESIDFILSLLDACRDISQLIQSTLQQFSMNSQALTSSTILAIGQILCDINSVMRVFIDNKATVMELIEQAIYKYQEGLIKLLESKKKSVTTDRKYTENKLDILSFLMLANTALVGPVNVNREVMVKVCFALVNSTGTNIFRDIDIKTIEQSFLKLRKLASFWNTVSSIQIIPELFWQTEILAVLLDDAFKHKTSHVISPLCQVWSNTFYKMIDIGGDNDIDEYTKVLEDIVEDNVVTPLCTELENQLRLVVFDRAGRIHIT